MNAIDSYGVAVMMHSLKYASTSSRIIVNAIYKQSGELNRLSMIILNNYNLSGGDKIE